jgi:uncharacterized protein YjbJ (UPF0337 family)
MQKDRIEGIGHQIKGAFKEGLGKIIGDAKLQHDGANERHGGEAQSAIDAGVVQVAGIDTDRLVGIGRQLKGALTEGIGNVLGNPALEAQGREERAAGKVQNAAGGARDEALEAHEDHGEPIVIEKTREAPTQPQ